MKSLIFGLALMMSAPALAVMECAGKTTEGHFVMLHMETTGADGRPSLAEVTIESGGNKFGYRFDASEVSQYFEYDDSSDNSAMVGLNAYVDGTNPVQVKYVGPNYVDMDLKAIIASGEPKGTKGNFMRLWKGAGHSATDQYQIMQIACSVWANL